MITVPLSRVPLSQKKSVHCEAILWPWYSTPSHEHPIKIRVTYNRKRKYFPIKWKNQNLFLKKEEWLAIQSNAVQLRGEKKQLRVTVFTTLSLAEQAVENITQNGKPFTFERFEKRFLAQGSSKGFIALFDSHLQGIAKEGRIGTFNAYRNSLQAFKKFRDNKEIDLVDITPGILRAFESYLEDKGLTRTTIGMYLRAIKVAYNVALGDSPSLAEFYPFALNRNDKNKFRIRAGSGKKGEALTTEQLKKFLAIETIAGTPRHEARLMWLFSFYAQGMNFRDMAFLKKGDLTEEAIEYVRSKTKNSQNREEKMQVPLNDTLHELINELKCETGDYVFKILSPDTSREKKDSLIRQKIKVTNKWLGRLCSENGLPPITTYWARHTYASLLKGIGESVDMIRELLGHSDIRTTEAYLKRFDLAKKRSVNEKILKSLESYARHV